MSGAEAYNIAQQMFGKTLRARQALVGDIYGAEGQTLDNGLVLYFPAPNSYTGENCVEFHCHGSPVVAGAVLRTMFALGARQALAGEFTRRAFLNGKLDLIQSEAVIDLIDAETEQAAVNAAAQLNGSISREVNSVYEDLTVLLAHFHAFVDYPDEDIGDVSDYPQIYRAIATLGKLLDTYNRGRIIRDGVRVALVGAPNVGKSSLLNALAGSDRAIVTNIPGTTRDTIEVSLVLNGLRVTLVDTAGLRDSADTIETMGVERSIIEIENCDLTLAVLDASNPNSDGETAEFIKKARRSLTVLNKCDLQVLNEAEGLRVSAKTGDGLTALSKTISEMFNISEAGNSAFASALSNERQYAAILRATDAIKTAEAALASGVTPDAALSDVEYALTALGEVNGRTVRSDITDTIFSRFCVGK
jgi:tRNA modification GTPase